MSSYYRYEYHVTNKNEMTLEAFEKWISGKEERGPMSELEKEIDNAHREQTSVITPAVVAQSLKGEFKY